jgi:hypothetical protein
MKTKVWPVLFAVTAVALAGVAYLHWGPAKDYKDPQRDALPIAGDFAGDSATKIVFLEQGWSPKQSVQFYNTPQGSRLVPYSWLLALEQPNKEAPFLAAEHIIRFRYLPQAKSVFNPDGLPVGFVKDGQNDWAGLTCAACHTTQINYQKTGIRIDGGPTLGDFNGLMTSLADALNQTSKDDAKFERFARKVLEDRFSEDEARILKAQLIYVTDLRASYNRRNLSSKEGLSGSEFGFGRIDAFGAILNQVLDHALDNPQNHKDANAPVSYPFLWDTPHHDVVQWNGSAPNRLGGALARNVGEVLGVFAELEIPASPSVLGYPSSVRVNDLRDLEDLIEALWSPIWPEQILPPLDKTKVAAGKALFATYCLECHPPIERKDPNRRILVKTDNPKETLLRDVGTDKAMSENFRLRVAQTGRLKGTRQPPIVGSLLKDKAPGDDVLVNVVVGTILHSPFSGPKDKLGELRERSKVLLVPDPKPNKYKSRPLNGIWATAPYLHNGSVANLYDLLQPADKRMREFHVGSREFDPKNVGFVTDKAEGTFLFKTHDEKNRPILGNSNAGHEYGTGVSRADGGDGLEALKEDQIWSLLEYLKSL